MYTQVEKGPVSITVASSSIVFAMYTGGVVTSPECGLPSADHAVLIVGYGTEMGR